MSSSNRPPDPPDHPKRRHGLHAVGRALIRCPEHGLLPIMETCGICHTTRTEALQEFQEALKHSADMLVEMFEEGKGYQRVLQTISELPCPDECIQATATNTSEEYVEKTIHDPECHVGIARAALDGCEVKILSRETKSDGK